MTVALLVAGWAALAMLVSPSGSRSLWKLSTRLQARVAFAALVGLALVPASILIVMMANALAELGGSGSLLDRCGKLIVALLHEPLARVDVTLSLLLLVLGAIGIVVGATRAWRSQASARLLARTGNGQLVLAPSTERFAFTTGLLRPRIVVSQGLVDDTPPKWRRVVLAHEDAHRRGRHPLLVLTAETLARGIPLLPLRWAADLLRLSLEAVADEHAARAVGDQTLVAEAIAGAALAPAGTVVSFEGNEVLRVRRLLAAPSGPHSIAGAALVIAVLALIGFAGAHAAHCGDVSVRSFQVTQCRFPH